MILIRNIYYMLAYAFHALNQDGYKNLTEEDFDNVHNLLAAIFSKGLAHQIKRGLGKEYVNKTETLSCPHGKISLSDTMRVYPVKKSVVCEFDEFSENSYYNQILKTTAMLMMRCDDVDYDIKKQIKKSLIYFQAVECIEVKEIQWRRLSFNRNNASYKMLLNICYLFLEGLLLSEHNGDVKFMNFLDDQKMHKLYEKFILEYYKKHFSFLAPAASEIDWRTDDGIIDFLPRMRSDITLTYENTVLIIDAKYYGKSMQTHHDVKTIHSGNLYQIFTYVKNKDTTNSGNVSGMLLYAKTDEEITPDDFKYKLSGSDIRVKTLDLNCQFSEIASQLDGIVAEWHPEATERHRS